MTDHNTTIEKKPFYFERILWIAAIATLLALYIRSCGNGAQPNAFAEKMMKEKAADSIKRVEERKQYQDSLKEINGREQLQESIIASQFRNLKIAEKRIDDLFDSHNKTQIFNTKDDGFYTVPQKYVSDCDTCFALLKSGRDSVRQYIHERDELDNLYKKDTALKGEYIAWLSKSNDEYAHQIIKWFNAYTKDTKPKSHLYAGAKISGNVITPFNQVGGMLNFLDKKGRMFTVGGGIQVQNSWYGELGISIRIF